MDNEKISNKDLLDIIKNGHLWPASKIKEHLEKLILFNSFPFNHDFGYDKDQNIFYVHDDDCYLFIFDRRIEVACNRSDGPSGNQTFDHTINSENDILAAYDHFKSILAET